MLKQEDGLRGEQVQFALAAELVFAADLERLRSGDVLVAGSFALLKEDQPKLSLKSAAEEFGLD